MEEEGNNTNAMYVSWINACLHKKRDAHGNKWFE